MKVIWNIQRNRSPLCIEKVHFLNYSFRHNGPVRIFVTPDYPCSVRLAHIVNRWMKHLNCPLSRPSTPQRDGRIVDAALTRTIKRAQRRGRGRTLSCLLFRDIWPGNVKIEFHICEIYCGTSIFIAVAPAAVIISIRRFVHDISR